MLKDAKLFEAGDYGDKGNWTEADLDTIVTNHTAAVNMEIEHGKTPFSGFLGSCATIWRKGKELFGSLDIPDDVLALTEKTGANKLSVALDKNTKTLKEVSYVRNPHIPDAAFSDVLVYFEGESLDEKAQDVRTAIYEVYPDSEGSWTQVDNIYDDYAIYRKNDRCYKIPYGKDANGVIQLGTPVEVVKKVEYEPVPQAFNQQIKTEVITVPETKVETPVIPETVDFSAELARRDTEINSLRAQMATVEFNARSAKVDTQIDGLLRAGKIVPAAAEFAKSILMNGSQTVTFGEGQTDIAALFSKFVDAMPVVVKFTESGKQKETTAVSTEAYEFAKKQFGYEGTAEEFAQFSEVK